MSNTKTNSNKKLQIFLIQHEQLKSYTFTDAVEEKTHIWFKKHKQQKKFTKLLFKKLNDWKRNCLTSLSKNNFQLKHLVLGVFCFIISSVRYSFYNWFIYNIYLERGF